MFYSMMQHVESGDSAIAIWVSLAIKMVNIMLAMFFVALFIVTSMEYVFQKLYFCLLEVGIIQIAFFLAIIIQQNSTLANFIVTD